MTSQSPTLRRALAPGSDGAHIEICHDRACATVEQTLDATGTHTTVPTTLSEDVYLGGARGSSATPITLTGPSGSDFGTSVASAGDLNGDGFADLVVGAINTDAVYVYLGSATGPSTTPVTLPDPLLGLLRRCQRIEPSDAAGQS